MTDNRNLVIAFLLLVIVVLLLMMRTEDDSPTPPAETGAKQKYEPNIIRDDMKSKTG